MLETGWLQLRRLADPARRVQLRRHLRVRRPRRASPNCTHGDSTAAEPVHGHAATRRARADPTAAQLRRPVDEDRAAVGSSPRRRTASGTAPLWEYFGGNNCPCGKLIWATRERLRHPHHPDVLGGARRQRRERARACRTRRRQQRARTRATGYWDGDRRVASCTRSVAATFFGDTRHIAPERAAHRRRVDRRTARATGCSGATAASSRSAARKFYGSTGDIAPEQAGQRHGTHRRRQRATGSSPTTAGSSRSATRTFYGSIGGHAPEPAGARHGAHRDAARATGCSRRDGGIFTFGDAKFYGSLGGTQLTSPVVSMQRTADGQAATGC